MEQCEFGMPKPGASESRKADGGLQLPAKVVQHRLGHSSITVTLDTGIHSRVATTGPNWRQPAAAERALLW